MRPLRTDAPRVAPSGRTHYRRSMPHAITVSASNSHAVLPAVPPGVPAAALLLRRGSRVLPSSLPRGQSLPPSEGRIASPRSPRFNILYADPPWSYRSWHADPGAARRLPSSRGRVPPYLCMSTPAIRAIPVRDITVADCALFLWATYPMLEDALSVIEAWGFSCRLRERCCHRSLA